MRIKLKILTFVLFILSACSEEKHRITVDKDFNYTITSHPWLKNHQWPNEFYGLNDIVKNEFCSDSTYADTCMLCFDSYISNDTVILYYENPDSFITIYIHDSTFETKLEYVTDIGNQYKFSGKPTGRFLANLKSQKLLLKDLNLKINDTIIGYIEIETTPFLKRDYWPHETYDYQYDKFAGSFISVIKDNKLKRIYTIP